MRVHFLPLALLATASFAQVDPARTVATVNGEEIKGVEYYRRMEYLPGVGKNFGRVFTEFPPGLLALDALITEKLILQMAREKNVFPADLEVTKEIERRTLADPAYATNWNVSGRTTDELRRQVLVELAQFKVQTAGITITDQEVDLFIKSQPARFTIPKSYKLRVIAVADEAGKTAVDADLKSGVPFAKVAETRSIDTTSRTRGGEYGTVPAPALAKTMRDAITSLKAGQATGWIATTQGKDQAFVKFLVDAINPERKITPDANIKLAVRRELMTQRGRIKTDLSKEMTAMRKKANINISSPEFAAAYKEFIAAYLSNKAGS